LYRLLLVLLGVCFIWLQYRLWWGVGSFHEIHQLQQNLSLLQETIQVSEERNLKLRMDIDNLKQNGGVLEELAREELGLIKSDEYFFRVIQKRKMKK